MIQKILLSICFFAVTLFHAAANPTDIIQEGNVFYGKNLYEKAIDKYLLVVNQGFESSELYYNLGNSYYKNNDYCNAIYYFEKSLRLNPADEASRFNLNVSNTKIADKIEEVPPFFLLKWWTSFSHILSLKQLSILGIVWMFLFFAMLASYLVSQTVMLRKLFFYSSALFLVLALYSIFSAYSQYKEMNRNDTAIVFEPTLTVKSSPDEKGNDIFVIHQGLKVTITDQLGEWSEIRLGNGSKGWVKNTTYKII